MAFTVNTNTGAMAALQSLSATNRGLATVQSRINTGLNVASTKDDSASFVIAQTLRGELGGLTAVNSSLSRAKSVTDVAIAGTEQISDIINQMKTKASLSADAGQDPASRAAINEDFKALRDQISTIIASSEFNGTNLLKTGAGTVEALRSLQDGDGATVGYQTDKVTVANQSLTLATTETKATAGTANSGVLGADSQIASAADALLMVETLGDLQKSLGTKLSTLGAASRQIDAQLTFTSKLSDVIEGGIGNLVDADLAKESAKLQSLQVKQQLGLQALSIANQAPQSIMSLFR